MSGWVSRLGAMIAVASLVLASAAHAADIKELTEKLPRAYIGEFLWDGDKTVQNVVFTFNKVRALNEQNAEASGCGSYQVGREVTTIKIRMFVRLPDLQVEIFEQSPEGNETFETGGSHRGKLSDDLQRIDAQWTTTASGQQGQLHLRAASSAACEPAASI
ncbi:MULTISPECIES: hypothetical protein [unclassified Bradyrhizobium]|uniref:hypothetical protein n=1 Tax=unclassified Bradyrhizobium TaxID=2631580 RepID=UPI002478A9FD|nr:MULTISPECIES: hypothetical protein [unclassified Bradyrhizobium]WGS21551.1 hypothetical protein MTX22_07490 [Bradyrhizobium sp. ISRA463]WGS28486.1 hypothetical protein MTX19_05325 [Bradyrhizobium sp. ISRA464]